MLRSAMGAETDEELTEVTEGDRDQARGQSK